MNGSRHVEKFLGFVGEWCEIAVKIKHCLASLLNLWILPRHELASSALRNKASIFQVRDNLDPSWGVDLW